MKKRRQQRGDTGMRNRDVWRCRETYPDYRLLLNVYHCHSAGKNGNVRRTEGNEKNKGEQNENRGRKQDGGGLKKDGGGG